MWAYLAHGLSGDELGEQYTKLMRSGLDLVSNETVIAWLKFDWSFSVTIIPHLLYTRRPPPLAAIVSPCVQRAPNPEHEDMRL